MKSNCNSNKAIQISNESKVIFDLSDEKFVHLGDALFFIPLIILLSKRCNTYILAPKSKMDFYSGLLADVNAEILWDRNILIENYDVLITVPYCLLSKKQFVNSSLSVGLGHSKLLSNIPYPVYLACQFNLFFFKKTFISDIESEYFSWTAKFRKFNEDSFNHNPKLVNLSAGKYFIVSPFIGSGKFRDFFNFQCDKILSCAELFKSFGYTPILVGSDKDKLIVDPDWIDLRGYPLDLIVATVSHNNVEFGIGFDNFWMHYFELNGKKYLTKFRGRFITRNRDIHLFSVNKSFGNSAKWYII